MSDTLKYDEVGEWTEIKIQIIEKYAAAYSTILSSQKRFTYFYIDAFAGAGEHVSRTTGEIIKGSPLVALDVHPKFDEYHLIDLKKAKTDNLVRLTSGHSNVYVYNQDCNKVMLEQIIPKVRYEDYKRALCILDPYGLHLSWEVIKQTGKMGTFDMFLNFPVADMNRNVLWQNRTHVSSEQLARMDMYWGDRAWEKAAYKRHPGLFEEIDYKRSNESIAEAFRKRLLEVAGFSYVSDPLPMRNSIGAVVYYLYFASQRPVAKEIVQDIFKMAKQGKYSVAKK
jgi:three-Cys-motif partner protein